MKLSIETTPFELSEIVRGSLAQIQELFRPPAPVPVSAYLTSQDALKLVAFELCTGCLPRSMIAMIKRYREITGANLKDAKDAVEAAFGAQAWIVVKPVTVVDHGAG